MVSPFNCIVPFLTAFFIALTVAEVQRVRSDFEVELGKIQRQRDRLGAKYTAEVEELRVALAAAERRLAEAEGKTTKQLN